MIKKILCLAGGLFGLVLWSNLSYAYEMAGAQRVKGTVTVVISGTPTFKLAGSMPSGNGGNTGGSVSGHPYEGCDSITVRLNGAVTQHNLITAQMGDKITVKGIILFNLTTTAGQVDFLAGNTVLFYSYVSGAMGSGYISDVMFKCPASQSFRITTPMAVMVTLFYTRINDVN